MKSDFPDDQTSHDQRPIGIFDSGIGGITVLRALLEAFPNEEFIYLGDTARLPYGTKSPETIEKYNTQNIQYLLGEKVKAIVVACNSASSHLPPLEQFPLPIYNVIDPGVRRALKVTTNFRIGVLGTRATIHSQSYAKRLRQRNPQVEVFAQSCPLFVPLAEEGWIEDPLTNLVAYRYIHPLLAENIDTLILGCTHYPILRTAIARVVGPHIHLVDSGEAIAHQLAEDLRAGERVRSSSLPRKSLSVRMTDVSEQFASMAEKLLAGMGPLDILHVDTF
jgi:glutamate racemase